MEAHETTFTSDVLGPPPPLRVSGLSQLSKSDLAIGETINGYRIIVAIRRSQAGRGGLGVTSALIETRTKLSPVGVIRKSMGKYDV